GRQTSRYVGLALDAEAARVLAAHDERQQEKVRRAREAEAIRRGEDAARAVETRGRDAGELIGLTPQEVYPEAFSAEERLDAKRRKERKLAQDRRNAERERAKA
ncbi:MAG: hypothetical protein M3P49_16140, partial [Actinomycetota bacterium]|nr:hypothetical protein [Actinomycetota bacterium]